MFSKSSLFILLIVLVVSFGKTRAQSIDSLIRELKSDKPDSVKAKIYNEISSEFRYSGNFDSSLIFGKRGLDISLSNDYFLTSAKLYNTIGTTYAFIGDDKNSEDNFNKAVAYALKSGNKKMLSKSYSNLGRLYFNLSRFNDAYKYYLMSLKINQEMNNLAGLATNYNNIGGLFYQQIKYPESLRYYEKSDSLYNLLPPDNEQAHVKNNIANIYTEMKKYDLAMNYFSGAFKIHSENENQLGLASIYENVGIVLTQANQLSLMPEGITFNGVKILKINFLDSALKFHRYAYDIYLQANYVFNFSSNLTGQGLIYYQKKNSAKAIELCKKGLLYADSTGSLDKKFAACDCLQKSYELAGDVVNSYKYFKEAITLRDSIYNKKNTEKFVHQQLSFEFEKKENYFKNEQEKKDIIHNNEKKRQQIIIYSVILILILIAVFSINVFRNYLAKKKANIELGNKNILIASQKHLVEEKNKEITDSINYAKRIQAAILPPNRLIKEALKECFVIYKPKDIVAGDFYWLEQKKDKVLFAAADCTGHGVPGAMVSVVCNNALNRSVREYGLTEPGEILDKTREIVIQEFEKSDEEVKDGMDISFCSISFSPLTLKWAGANNPIWHIRNNVLSEIKADKQPIGKYADQNPFTTHEIELRPGDTFYIFTDGYQDQFGGEKGKKFKASKLKELIVSLQELTLEEQKVLIIKAFDDWKGETEQVDDVCIIGVRV